MIFLNLENWNHQKLVSVCQLNQTQANFVIHLRNNNGYLILNRYSRHCFPCRIIEVFFSPKTHTHTTRPPKNCFHLISGSASYVAPLCSEKAMLRLPSSCLFVAEKKGIQSGSNTGLILTWNSNNKNRIRLVPSTFSRRMEDWVLLNGAFLEP